VPWPRQEDRLIRTKTIIITTAVASIIAIGVLGVGEINAGSNAAKADNVDYAIWLEEAGAHRLSRDEFEKSEMFGRFDILSDNTPRALNLALAWRLYEGPWEEAKREKADELLSVSLTLRNRADALAAAIGSIVVLWLVFGIIVAARTAAPAIVGLPRDLKRGTIRARRKLHRWRIRHRVRSLDRAARMDRTVRRLRKD